MIRIKSEIKQERQTLDDTYGRVNEILSKKAPERMEPPRRSDVYEATEITLTRKESQATAADVAEPITEQIDETQADSSSESEITITETATATVTQKPDSTVVDDKTEPKESIQQSVKEVKDKPDQPEQTEQPERPEAPPKLQPQPNAPPPAQTQSAPVFVGNGNDTNKETQEELYNTRKVSHGLKVI